MSVAPGEPYRLYGEARNKTVFWVRFCFEGRIMQDYYLLWCANRAPFNQAHLTLYTYVTILMTYDITYHLHANVCSFFVACQEL